MKSSKILGALVATLGLITLVSCGDKPSPTGSETSATSSSSSSSSTTTSSSSSSSSTTTSSSSSSSSTTTSSSSVATNVVYHSSKVATCTEEGNLEYWTCDGSDDYYQDEACTVKYASHNDIVIPALGHHLTHTEAKEATCMEEGNLEYWYCDVCHNYYRDGEGSQKTTLAELTVAKKAHTLTKVEAKEATCSEDGNIEYYVCSVCNKYFSDEDGKNELTSDDIVIKALGHTSGYVYNGDAVYKVSDGTETLHCDRCGIDDTRTCEGSKDFAPFIGKTYTTVEFSVRDDLNGAINGYNNSYCIIKTDKNGYCAVSSAPFRGLVFIELVDEEKGLIRLINYTETIDVTEEEAKKIIASGGYILPHNSDSDYWYQVKPEGAHKDYEGTIDFETGVITFKNPAKESVLVLIQGTYSSALTNASSFSDGNNICYAATVGYGEKTINVFVDGTNTYVGVKFENESQEIEGGNCYNSSYLKVTLNDTTIAEYVYEANGMHKVDEFKGEYTNESGNSLVLSGYSVATLGDKTGSYEVIDGDVYITFEDSYVKVVFNENSFTLVDVKVTINFVYIDFESYNTTANVYKNFEVTFPTTTIPNYELVGWYYDEDCLNEVELVDGKLVATADMTIYSLWGEQTVINVSGLMTKDNDKEIVHVAAGQGLTFNDILPDYTASTVDYKQSKKFVGWYSDAEYKTALNTSAEITEAYSGMTVYAKWDDVATSYGTYTYKNVYNGNGGTITPEASASNKISEAGVVTGMQNTGTLSSADQKVVDGAIKIGSGYAYFNREAGLVWMAYRSGKDTVGNDTALYVNAGIVKSFTYTSKKYDNDYTIWGQITYVDGTTAYALLTNNKIYAGVEFVGANVSNATSTAHTITKDGITFAEYDGTSIIIYDGYQGTYTTSNEDITLDGKGGFTWGAVSGTYNIISETEVGLYTVSNGKNIEYNVMNIFDSSATMVKPVVNVTFDLNDHGENIDLITMNTNIIYTLPTPTDENYTFKGWFYDEALTKAVEADFVAPSKNVTLFAKWASKITVNVNKDNSEEVENLILGVGDTLTLDRPVKKGYAFVGWFTDETLKTEWTNGSVVEANMSLYAKWEDANPLYGDYGIANSYWSSLSKVENTIHFDEYGVLKTDYSSGLFKADSIKCVDFNKENGKFVLEIKYEYNEYSYGTAEKYTKYILGLYDEKTGFVLIKSYSSLDEDTGYSSVDYVKNNAYLDNSVYVLSNKCLDGNLNSNVNVKNLSSAYRLYQYNDGSFICNYFVDGHNTIYSDFTAYDIDGNEIEYANLTAAKYARITALGKEAFEYGYNGSSFKSPLDGYQGVYTFNDSTLKVYGTGIANLDGTEIKYTVTEGVLISTYSVNDVSEYHEIKLNKNDMTFENTKPMVTITYILNNNDITDATAPDAASVNKNIAVKTADNVTTAAGQFIFRGWNTKADGSGTAYKALASITVSEDITLYAMWDKAVVLTVVNGNGIENTVITKYYANDTFELTEPTGGTDEALSFAGWYLDAEFKEALTSYVIEDNMSVYAKWITPYAQAGTYNGAEIYSTGASYAKAADVSSLPKDLTITNTGVVTGTKSGNIAEEYKNVTDGVVKVDNQYFYMNTTYGVLWTAFGKNSTSVSANDTYVFYDTAKIKHVAYSGTSIYDSSNYMVWLELTLMNDDIVKVYGYKSVLHAGYNWSIDTVSARVSSFVMYDETNKPVCKFDYDNKEILSADGLGGTYSNETLGSISVDGYGTITFADNTTAEYVVANNKLTYVRNNQMFIIELANESYTQVLDGNEGTYTSEGLDSITLDGYGHYTKGSESGTYVVEGTNVTLYANGSQTGIGIDVTNKTYVTKSIFAGLTFVGSEDCNEYQSKLKITFTDSASISGTFALASVDYNTASFTGTYDADSKTLTLNLTHSTNSDLNNKTVVLKVESGKLTITSSNTSGNAYTLSVGYVVSCIDFVL